MTEIFADTSGWANYFVRSEPFHAVAVQLMRQWHQEGIKVVTTNYILAELVALFSSPLKIPRQHQIQAVETISSSCWTEVIHVDPLLHGRAWDFLKKHDDKMWSLVDCSSFIVMQERGISAGFTTDHHFEQAGFLRLLK
jgi:predicted nucleic acid-binding protein